MQTSASLSQKVKTLVLISSALLMTACAGTRPANLGVTADGTLLTCPDSPNCVSSFEDKMDKEHYIRPYQISGENLSAWNSLKKSIQATEDAKLINTEKGYIYAEYTSSVFQFVDDVEFMLDTSGNQIHLRSASRIGYSDLGANRKRLNELEAKLKKQGVLK